MFKRIVSRNIKNVRNFSSLESNPITRKVFGSVNPLTIGMTGFSCWCIYYVYDDSNKTK